MKQKRLWMLAAILICGTVSALAQQNVKAENGKAVRRITFDREQVTIIYADGTTESNVQQTTIRRTKGTTGISSLSKTESTSAVYNLNGQKMVNGKSANGKLPKGVYIEREGNRVRKTVKK